MLSYKFIWVLFESKPTLLWYGAKWTTVVSTNTVNCCYSPELIDIVIFVYRLFIISKVGCWYLWHIILLIRHNKFLDRIVQLFLSSRKIVYCSKQIAVFVETVLFTCSIVVLELFITCLVSVQCCCGLPFWFATHFISALWLTKTQLSISLLFSFL